MGVVGQNSAQNPARPTARTAAAGLVSVSGFRRKAGANASTKNPVEAGLSFQVDWADGPLALAVLRGCDCPQQRQGSDPLAPIWLVRLLSDVGALLREPLEHARDVFVHIVPGWTD